MLRPEHSNGSCYPRPLDLAQTGHVRETQSVVIKSKTADLRYNHS